MRSAAGVVARGCANYKAGPLSDSKPAETRTSYSGANTLKHSGIDPDAEFARRDFRDQQIAASLKSGQRPERGSWEADVQKNNASDLAATGDLAKGHAFSHGFHLRYVERLAAY
jgi:hypothetical protein